MGRDQKCVDQEVASAKPYWFRFRDFPSWYPTSVKPYRFWDTERKYVLALVLGIASNFHGRLVVHFSER